MRKNFPLRATKRKKERERALWWCDYKGSAASSETPEEVPISAPPRHVRPPHSLSFPSPSLSNYLRAAAIAPRGSQWVPTELQGRLTGDAQHPRTQPVSVYTLGGATEASIWSCYYPVESVAPEWKSIPYGKPLANQGLYVLDRHLNIMPSLVPGEICIGGVGLAECYWADRAKTDAAFVYGAPRGERERLYKTGDMGRYMADGSVEILGRMDFQLKLHGYRIEIG